LIVYGTFLISHVHAKKIKHCETANWKKSNPGLLFGFDTYCVRREQIHRNFLHPAAAAHFIRCFIRENVAYILFYQV